MNKITTFYEHVRGAMAQENMTLEEVAEKLVSAGITGVEVDYRELTKELATQLDKVGLPISGVFCTFNWDKKRNSPDYINYKDVIKTLRKCDVKNLLVIPGFTAEGQKHEAVRKKFVPKIAKLCERAAKYDINVVMEDYDGVSASFGRAEHVKWYLDQIPALGCAFDTGNFYFFGEDAYAVLPMFLDRITYVHCKDRTLTPNPNESAQTTITGRDMYPVAVGSGIIAMTDILKEILEAGYEGPLAIEHFGSSKQMSDMLKSAEYLNGIIL